MKTQQLIKHQIKVEIVKSSEEIIKIILPDEQSFNWPINDASLVSGQFYITLSSKPQLPDKQELAKLVLKEILQNGR